MSIHRTDRPDAPYRIRKSELRPRRWIWRHDGCSYGNAPTREQAAALAAIHATTEHGANLDHLRSLFPRLREMGVLDFSARLLNATLDPTSDDAAAHERQRARRISEINANAANLEAVFGPREVSPITD